MNRSNRRRSRTMKKQIITLITLALVATILVTGLTISLRSAEQNSPLLQQQAVAPVPATTTAPTKDPVLQVQATKAPVPTKQPVSSTTGGSKKPEGIFSDTVFIGDSRTEGLQLNTGLTGTTFITARGLNVSKALHEKVIKLKNGKKGTVIDALKQGSYKRVFIMFGVNELGWPYVSTFESKYGELIAAIQQEEPEATIYVQSILPVTSEKSSSDKIYNNKRIAEFNKALKKMCKEKKVHYLDVSKAVVDKNGFLPADATTDGIHLNKKYCKKWLAYLKTI